MIPSFIVISGAHWPLLPPGIHDATLAEISTRYADNPHRKTLFDGLKLGLDNLFGAGCPQIFLDGSFISAKPNPGDYDLIWDPRHVDPFTLDQVIWDLRIGTVFQKQKYLGEYFPLNFTEAGSGKPFLDFFQTDKQTGLRKGIIRLLNYLNTGGVL
jgi:hypothetical protein